MNKAIIYILVSILFMANVITAQPVDDTMAGYNKVENAFTKP